MFVLGLMSLCHEGHGHGQHLSALLGGTLDIIWMIYEESDNPGPVNFLTAFETGTGRFSGFGEVRESGQLLWPDKRPLLVSGILFWGFFISYGTP